MTVDAGRRSLPAKPTVSIVIPARNSADTVGDTLRALDRQIGPGALEVIVVDNGSTDGTTDVARAFGATVLEEPTPGPSAARNRGLHHASGDIVAHVDADTVPTRQWLGAIASPFDDPDVLLVAGRNISYPPRTAAERYVAASGLIETERAVSRPVFPFSPSMNMAVRRDAALGIGGWSEDLRTGEDVDFSFRLRRARGCTIEYAADAIVFHRNRNDDDALRRQAWTYGEGAASLYRKYPEEVGWSARMLAVLVGQLATRAARPPLLALARRAGIGSAEELEFARYHWLWTWAFWRGFASRYWGAGVRRA
jgi:glycosyltransferase involved in cell wall biosynthesis